MRLAQKAPLAVMEHDERPRQSHVSGTRHNASVAHICRRSQEKRSQNGCQFPDASPALVTSSDLRDNRRFAVPVPPYTRGFEDACYEHTYTNPYKPGTIAAGAYDEGFVDGRHTAGEAAR